MANDRLQELSERLYSEGLAKGREEGEKILESSKRQARQILDQAREQAQGIIDEATALAEKNAAKASSDIKMASIQALDATKERIENVIQTKMVDEKVSAALSDEDFIKEIISLVASRFSSETSEELAVILPQSLKESIGDFVTKEVASAIGRGIEVAADKKMKAGFSIGPRDGKYYVSFSGAAFSEIIREYLRPATRKVLFGE